MLHCMNKASILVLMFFFYSFTTLATTNIVIIGDSHSAGPFGKYLLQNLASNADINVALYGHSSSAPVHWLNSKEYKLSGGVQHRLSFEGVEYSNPNPTHWRTRVTVPKIENIFAQLAYHDSWQREIGNALVDVAVIALGANDYRAISDANGNPTSAFYSRQAYIQQMIDKLEEKNIQCVWIGPPNGIKKTDKRQNLLYRFLTEAIKNRCPMLNSNHYKATSCDGVHFSCRSGYEKAKQWAKEASDFVLQAI